MSPSEILKILETKKESMFLSNGQAAAQLKPEYTRDEAKKLFQQIESVKTAIKERYAFNGSIADYLTQYLEKRGYNQYTLETRLKHVKLYKSPCEWIIIKDKTGKNFLFVYFEIMGILPIDK